MRPRKTTPAVIVKEIRLMLKSGGSAEHARGVQRFFKEQIGSRGWRTADLRRLLFDGVDGFAWSSG